MVSVATIMTTENPVFAAYIFYCTVLVIKMLIMAPLTARQRIAKRVFASPEDTVLDSKSKVKHDDPDVERVRRAHLNDLENIPVFFVMAFFYLLTSPSPWLAINLFRLFTVSRIVHTIVYAIVVLPQPARGLAFVAGIAVNVYMAIVTLATFLYAA